jgi:hypothetical protein
MAAAGWHGVEGNAPKALRDVPEHSPCKRLLTAADNTSLLKDMLQGDFHF